MVKNNKNFPSLSMSEATKFIKSYKVIGKSYIMNSHKENKTKQKIVPCCVWITDNLPNASNLKNVPLRTIFGSFASCCCYQSVWTLHLLMI